jgi:hypothetical protein
MKDVYAINRIHFAKRVESDNVSPALFFFLTLRRRTNKVEVIPAVVDRGELEVRGVDEQQQVSKCKGLPSKKTESCFVQRVHTRKPLHDFYYPVRLSRKGYEETTIVVIF